MVRYTDCNTTAVKAPHTPSRHKGSSCSHSKISPVPDHSSIMSVAIVPQACDNIFSSPTTLDTHLFRLNMHLLCVTWGYQKFVGPFLVEDTVTQQAFTPAQLRFIYKECKVLPVIRHHSVLGIWVGSTCTRECRHAFFG